MNIPLHRLYHFIEDIADKVSGSHVLIYRFWPDGSKNIQDLRPLTQSRTQVWMQSVCQPYVWCNDQEPLNFHYYSQNLFMDSRRIRMQVKNLNYNHNIFSKNLLLHSEKRSSNLERYESDGELISVYYWSHGVIARDWFRFAEHVDFSKKSTHKKLFLVYNRSWTGTREYRLKFLDLLHHHDLLSECMTWFNAVDSETGTCYQQHVFQNPVWRPVAQLEHNVPVSTASSNSSADFDESDYRSTQIEVVLETLFDDARWHLTEKILRPLACCQPFILVATAGSLEYLRSYGFKTFHDLWDESYDSITDPVQRLERIVALMKDLVDLSALERNKIMEHAQQIAVFNHKRFFSQEFFDQLISELTNNLISAFDQQRRLPYNKIWLDKHGQALTDKVTAQWLRDNQDLAYPTYEQIKTVLQQINQPGRHTL